jgi:hypothetical protein
MQPANGRPPHNGLTARGAGEGIVRAVRMRGGRFRLSLAPNERVQPLHEIIEQPLTVVDQLRRSAVFKTGSNKACTENRGHVMERLRCVKHGRSPL